MLGFAIIFGFYFIGLTDRDRFSIRSDVVIGVAIGTAGLARESEAQAALSSVAIALSGVVASLAFIPLYW